LPVVLAAAKSQLSTEDRKGGRRGKGKAMDAIEVDPVARLLYAGGPISSNNGIETEPIDVIKGVVSVSDHPGGGPPWRTLQGCDSGTAVASVPP